MSKKKTLAIVSTYEENCGNASYTHVLKNAFSKFYDVEVIPLDIYLLQRPGKNVEKFGDSHIKDICARVKNFDFVNVQFEAGLYGASVDSILRRVLMLVNSAPNLIFTMHRIDLPQPVDIVAATLSSVRNLKLAPINQAKQVNAFPNLYAQIIQHCRRLSRRKNVWIKVHTRREARVVRDVLQAPNVFDYPLSFLDLKSKEELMSKPAQDLAKRFFRPTGTRFLGVFGYISNYKGIETAIKALRYLPKNWELLIVGSQHPQSLREYSPIDPFLSSILDGLEKADKEGFGRSLDLEKFLPVGKPSGKGLLGEVIPSKDDLDASIMRSMSTRVHFCGNLEDIDFVGLLKDIDVVVLPYLEVGQSMSGVVMLAMEANARIIAANNRSFNEVRRYFGNVFEGFDIGNHIELSQKILGPPLEVKLARDKAFSVYNIESSVELQRQYFEEHKSYEASSSPKH